MRQDELRPPAGAKHGRRRVGRGDSSGRGTYSGRGCKGQKSRSGGGVRLGFEGGQLPLIERLPRKRGFTNVFRVEYSIVNVGKLGVFSSGAEVGPAELLKAGLIDAVDRPIKVLGHGDIRHPLVVTAHKFSSSAAEKISAAGGKTKQA